MKRIITATLTTVVIVVVVVALLIAATIWMEHDIIRALSEKR